MADKVLWQKNQRENFRMVMRMELDRALGERSDLERDWRQRLETYRARQEDAMSNYPFEGASNLTYPLAAMTLDPILARYMTSIHATENLDSRKPFDIIVVTVLEVAFAEVVGAVVQVRIPDQGNRVDEQCSIKPDEISELVDDPEIMAEQIVGNEVVHLQIAIKNR